MLNCNLKERFKVARDGDLPTTNDDLKKRSYENVLHCAQGLKIFENEIPPKDIIQLGNKEILQKNFDEQKLLVTSFSFLADFRYG
jgi:hypothetical protein